MTVSTILKPLITEKTLRLAQTMNTYTFQVERHATKYQVQAAVQQLYPELEVVSVNTVLSHRSLKAAGKRRLKMRRERTKKALITLKAGQRIELFDMPASPAEGQE